MQSGCGTGAFILWRTSRPVCPRKLMQICFMVYFAGQLISHWEVQRLLDKPCAAACKTLWQCTPSTHTFLHTPSFLSLTRLFITTAPRLGVGGFRYFLYDGAASGRRRMRNGMVVLAVAWCLGSWPPCPGVGLAACPLGGRGVACGLPSDPPLCLGAPGKCCCDHPLPPLLFPMFDDSFMG